MYSVTTFMSTGKRYSKEEKEEIMQYRQSHTYLETAQKYDVSQMTLARWSKKYGKLTLSGDRFIGDSRYRNYLNVLKYIPGVKGVCIYSDMTDGSSLVSLMESSLSEDVIFLGLMSVLSATSRYLEDLDLGNLKSMSVESDTGALLIRGINSVLLMVLIFESLESIYTIVQQNLHIIERVGADIGQTYDHQKSQE